MPQRQIINECLAGLIDQGAPAARGGVYLDQAIELMPALVIFESEAAAVRPPPERGKFEDVREEGIVNHDLAPDGNVEQDRLGQRKDIARPGIEYC